MKRRDPKIQALARQYNVLCKEMADLIKKNQAPRNAIAPHPIGESIWKLDVDDDIWQDLGLDDTYDNKEPPLWLKSDAVRDGIKAMLQLDRCAEEEPRVFHECRALRYWLSEEWDAVTSAMQTAIEVGKTVAVLQRELQLTIVTGNTAVAHQLGLRKQELCQMCVMWMNALRPIPFKTEGLPEWGPTEAELMAVRIEDVVFKIASSAQQVDREEDEEEEEEDGAPSDEEDEDDLPIEEIEAFTRVEVYAEETQRHLLVDVDWTDDRDNDETWFAT